MIDLSVWRDQNNLYLASSLEWLRLRLEQIAVETPHPTIETGSIVGRGSAPPAAASSLFTAAPPRARFGWWRRRERAAMPLPDAMIPASDAPSIAVLAPVRIEDRIARAAEARAQAASMQPPPALHVLAQQLNLTEFEREVLLLCAGVELDTRIGGLCGQVHVDPLRSHPTFALALCTFAGATWDALSPHRPLRYWHLVELAQSAGTPLTLASLRADERIVNYIKGLNDLDDRLSNLLLSAGPGSPHLSTSQQAAVEEIVWHCRPIPGQRSHAVVQLLGSDLQSKQLIAHQAAQSLQRDLHIVAVSDLVAPGLDGNHFARLWQRESLLLPLVLFVDAQTDDNPEALRPFLQFVARGADANGIVLVGVRDALPPLASTSVVVEVSKPSFDEQRESWVNVFADGSPASQMAAQFNLNLPDIEAFGGQLTDPTMERAWALCCLKTRARLDTLAQRLQPKATWDDLVLTEEPLRLLRTIADQVRQRARVYQEWGFRHKLNRGMGISALFAGESGTGKTMAAEVIASELNVNLYRIDLSAVVSKYIGDTEKNLRQLFDAAEDGGDLLFFDEADALFGKRSEVKDSHDRYANIEVNYLLQRMEAYGGLAVLATNMKTAIDPGFMRRLRFVVNFVFPSVAERKIIWQKVFPDGMPREDLDLDRLARLALTGGNIQSIAVNAAFQAAQNDTRVNMPLVLAAARMELRKLEKPINESEFRI